MSLQTIDKSIETLTAALTVESLTLEIESTREAFKELAGRRPPFTVKEDDQLPPYKSLGQFEEQAIVRLAERIDRLYLFRNLLAAKQYAEAQQVLGFK